MHYNIDYSDLDPIAKHNKAIEDIKGYIGAEKFEQVTACLKAAEPTFEQFELMVSFAGVQGYPVKAWYNYCFGL